MRIDFHTHLFPPSLREVSLLKAPEPAFRTLYGGPGVRFAGPEDLLTEMETQGVAHAVVFGFPWDHPAHYECHNAFILETIGRFPGRLSGLCCFSPLARGAVREAERCLDAGLSGVGELAVYGSGLTGEVIAAMEEVMALCRERDVPLLLHTNEPVGHLYPGKAPMTLGQIFSFLKAYPDNRIVLAHWGGGIPFYGLLKKEMKEVFRNVLFDTAASPFLYDPRVYRILGEIVGYEKILFGSDYPLLSMGRYLREIAQGGLTQEATERILGGNAAVLLGLDRSCKPQTLS